jgi:hypothetical protein
LQMCQIKIMKANLCQMLFLYQVVVVFWVKNVDFGPKNQKKNA